jgi:branched-chain amino acid transport system substrate-binding protein
MRKALFVTGYLLVFGLFAFPATTCAPTPAHAAASPAVAKSPVPVVGAIPEEFLKGTLPAPKFSGEIRLGALYPRSGPNSYLGEETWRGVELATKVQNAKGGINGKEIKITVADAPDIQTGVSEVERLINKEGLKVVMGTFTSGVAYATSAVAERNGVIYWETNGVADNLTQRGFKYLFRPSARTSQQAAGAVNITKDVLASMFNIPANQLKVAIINEDSQWGSEVGHYAEQFSKATGFQLVAHEAYSTKAIDLSSVVLKLKSLDPDVVIAASYTPDATLFWKQSRELQFMPKALVGTDSGYTARDFYKAFGSDANGVFSSDFPQYDQNPEAAPGITEYMQLYRKTYNEEMRGPQSLVAFTGASTLFDVLARAKSMDPEVIRTAALETDIPLAKTPVGWGVKFAPPGDPNMGTNLRTYMAVMQWQEGKYVTVYPKEMAAGSIQYVPMRKWSERR